MAIHKLKKTKKDIIYPNVISYIYEYYFPSIGQGGKLVEKEIILMEESGS